MIYTTSEEYIIKIHIPNFNSRLQQHNTQVARILRPTYK